MSIPSSSALVDHSDQLSLGQAGFDVPALGRGVAGPVRGDPARERGIVEPSLRELIDELRRPPAPREADRANAGFDQVREKCGGFAQARGTTPRALVEQRRVAHHDLPLPPRCAVAVDEVELDAGELVRELNRIGDRGGGEDETRSRPVGSREPSQAAQHVCHVRPEHAPVNVCLVDDHEREVCEEVTPAVVVGKDADVQHVRVGEDEIRALSDRRPLALGSVTVVDRVPKGGHAQLGQRPRLILCERLGRVQIQRPGPRVGGEHVQRREVEAERLAARRAGRHDRVAAFHHALPRVGLVRIERVDAGVCERLLHGRVQLVRDRAEEGLLRELLSGRDQPLVLAGDQPFERIGPVADSGGGRQPL